MVVVVSLGCFPWGMRARDERQNGLYQLVVLHRPRAAELLKLAPPALKSPALHLFVRHELQRAVAHAHQRERRAEVEPAQTLGTIYRAGPTWKCYSIRKNLKGPATAGRENALQMPL